MIIELTPDNFFTEVKIEGPLHVVMHYGVTCGPCKVTMPHYEAVVQHYAEYSITNVKFYRFHQWEPTFKEFITENNLQTKGVPSFRYYYMGELVQEEARSFNDSNELKQHIVGVTTAVESMMGGFDLYAS